MNIVFVTSNISTGGGVERVLSINTEQLIQKGFNISIISLNDEIPFYEFNEKINIISLKNKRNIFFKLLELKKTIDSGKYSYVIGMSISKLNLILSMLFYFNKDFSFIASEHISSELNNNIIIRVLKRIFYKNIDRLVLLTEGDIEKNEKYNNNICVIRNPIILPTDVSFLDKEKIILYIGHINQRKNVIDILIAWNKVKDKRDWKLYIVGDGDMKSSLLDYINANNLNDFVMFLGSIKNVDEIYRKSSIFMMTSKYEGLPMVLLEAMSYGCCLLSYDCPTGPREIISKNNGFLIENGNVDKLHFRLEELMINSQLRYDIFLNNINDSKYYSDDFVSKEWTKLLK